MGSKNMTELIKMAIADPEMRAKLVSDPFATCNLFGIKTGPQNQSYSVTSSPMVDSTTMQGRFRP